VQQNNSGSRSILRHKLGGVAYVFLTDEVTRKLVAIYGG